MILIYNCDEYYIVFCPDTYMQVSHCFLVQLAIANTLIESRYRSINIALLRHNSYDFLRAT